MPRATVSKQTEHKPLTTLPSLVDGEEGGWVELRRLSYGEKIAKDAEAMKMKFGMEDAMAGSLNAEVAMINERVTLLEFQKCIVAHNLTALVDEKDESKGERPLDFKKFSDVQMLDPRVGDEISTLIGEMNDFEKAVTQQGVDARGK